MKTEKQKVRYTTQEDAAEASGVSMYHYRKLFAKWRRLMGNLNDPIAKVVGSGSLKDWPVLDENGKQINQENSDE